VVIPLASRGVYPQTASTGDSVLAQLMPTRRLLVEQVIRWHDDGKNSVKSWWGGAC